MALIVEKGVVVSEADFRSTARQLQHLHCYLSGALVGLLMSTKELVKWRPQDLVFQSPDAQRIDHYFIVAEPLPR